MLPVLQERCKKKLRHPGTTQHDGRHQSHQKCAPSRMDQHSRQHRIHIHEVDRKRRKNSVPYVGFKIPVRYVAAQFHWAKLPFVYGITCVLSHNQKSFFLETLIMRHRGINIHINKTVIEMIIPLDVPKNC